MSARVIALASRTILGAALCAASGCSSKANLVGEGGSCQEASDCAAGLICEPQKSGGSICSSDLSGVQQLPASPDAGGSKDAAAPVADTGTAVQQDSAAPPPDSAAAEPDASSPPPSDAASE
ncbi:MAG TPA: hypothetical protein VGI39_33840 [Polyangiaceae bacterium]